MLITESPTADYFYPKHKSVDTKRFLEYNYKDSGMASCYAIEVIEKQESYDDTAGRYLTLNFGLQAAPKKRGMTMSAANLKQRIHNGELVYGANVSMASICRRTRR